MIKLRLLLLISIASQVLYGCANVGVTKMHGAEPKQANCSLDIFSSPNEIKRAYEVVCLIDSRTGTTAFHTKTAAAAIEQAKPSACECGADGILIDYLDTEGATLATWGKGEAVIKAVRYID